jgi:hypothetical protein
MVAMGISVTPPGYEEASVAAKHKESNDAPYGAKTEPGPIVETTAELKKPATPPLTVREKFTSRSKILQTVIPVKGDSIELRFYDNAEIDGDSIAIFLNGQMLEQHILHPINPYSENGYQ